jgi:3-oxoacyl-[acyl-carrier protein] reductase
MDLGIAGCRAVVTAGTAGFGRACAAALIAEGVRVTICGSDTRRAAVVGEELGAEAVAVDLTDPQAAGEFVAQAHRRMGGLDILVANGPGPAAGRAADLHVDDARAAVETSLLPVVAMCQAALPGMRAQGWGRIVAITSLGTSSAVSNLGSSNTARAGVTGYLRTLAREVAGEGAR